MVDCWCDYHPCHFQFLGNCCYHELSIEMIKQQNKICNMNATQYEIIKLFMEAPR